MAALVADDSTVNRRILAACSRARRAGDHARPAAIEAIALARKHRPNVVFMDLKMGDLDGLEATRRLQGRRGDGRHSGDRGHGQRLRRHARGGARRRLRRLPAEAGARRGRCSRRCRTHLGVRFVSGRRRPPRRRSRRSRTGARRRDIAARLRRGRRPSASITDLEALAQELMAGEAGRSGARAPDWRAGRGRSTSTGCARWPPSLASGEAAGR